jgi:hypothetical protein
VARRHAGRNYHVEYGYSCMGYEIAGGLGAKLARPEREVIVMVGDGSYLMMNSEIATSVMLGAKLIVVVLDNRGYGCINRLQQACGGAPFNNLLDDCVQGPEGAPDIDFAMHARALGAQARACCEYRRTGSRHATRTRLDPLVSDQHRHRSGTAPPKKAAGGGKSRCRKCHRVKRCARRAQTMNMKSRRVRSARRNEAMTHVRCTDRHQSAVMDERRPALARRRNPARAWR